MKRLILLAAILISGCAVPIQPELPLPPSLTLPTLTEEQETRLKAWDNEIFEVLVRRETTRQRRIETLEMIIKTTH